MRSATKRAIAALTLDLRHRGPAFVAMDTARRADRIVHIGGQGSRHARIHSAVAGPIVGCHPACAGINCRTGYWGRNTTIY
jgi:hypothetical protein